MNNRILCLLIVSLTNLGCKREEPNPELLDPIYLDLIKERGGIEQFKEDTIKKIESAEKSLAKTLPRTLDRKNSSNDVQKEKRKLQKAIELIEYFDLRSKERFVEARRQYRAAFSKNEVWPDKNEYAAYVVNKRLMHASKNWDDRVPRSKMQQIQLDKPDKPAATAEEPSSEKKQEE